MRLVEWLNAHVVIRVGGIPVEPGRDRAARYDGSDDEGAIGCLLRVRLHHVADGGVGANAYRLRRNGVLILSLDFARMSRLGARDTRDVRPAIDLSAGADDRVGEPRQVLEDVELPLVGPLERGPGIEVGDRRALDHRDVVRAGPMRGDELLLELLLLLVRPEDEIAIESAEVAVDVLEPNDLLDPIDGSHVALDDEPSVDFAVDGLESVDAVVHRPGEVGSGASGLPAADRSVVDHHYLLARFEERVGGREAGNAGADDADVSD